MTERALKAYVRVCVDRRVCDELANLKKELKLKPPGRRLMTLREAVDYKGGSFNTIKDRPKRQPRGGKPDMMLLGKKTWKASSVSVWAAIHDGNLEEYLRACEVGQESKIEFS